MVFRNELLNVERLEHDLLAINRLEAGSGVFGFHVPVYGSQNRTQQKRSIVSQLPGPVFVRARQPHERSAGVATRQGGPERPERTHTSGIQTTEVPALRRAGGFFCLQ
jgi:hypothetical protein